MRYTAEPFNNSPSWYISRKSPTGDVGRASVRLSPNYLGDNTVFCGTRDGGAGQESAFSVSTDKGVSFNQESLIDLALAAGGDVVQIDGTALAPDGSCLYMGTDDTAGVGVGAAIQLSLWKTTLPITSTSWSRIYCKTAIAAATIPTVTTRSITTANYIFWATNPEVYFIDASATTSNLFASLDGGATFSIRSTGLRDVNFVWAAGPKLLYLATHPFGVNAGPNVYKSVNGGLVWSAAVNALSNNLWTVFGFPGDLVLAGGTGACSISTDGGAPSADSRECRSSGSSISLRLFP